MRGGVALEKAAINLGRAGKNMSDDCGGQFTLYYLDRFDNFRQQPLSSLISV